MRGFSKNFDSRGFNNIPLSHPSTRDWFPSQYIFIYNIILFRELDGTGIKREIFFVKQIIPSGD